HSPGSDPQMPAPLIAASVTFYSKDGRRLRRIRRRIPISCLADFLAARIQKIQSSQYAESPGRRFKGAPTQPNGENRATSQIIHQLHINRIRKPFCCNRPTKAVQISECTYKIQEAYKWQSD
ncbi:hypothetical protein, partial [Sphingobium yanoikuyae]|uniref:hypothetical protein n=1 Tax=Sphingobium yanoikuyae TaxID=13690 RepID=UPI001BDDE95E